MSEFGGGKCPNFGGGKCPPGKWLTIGQAIRSYKKANYWVCPVESTNAIAFYQLFGFRLYPTQPICWKFDSVYTALFIFYLQKSSTFPQLGRSISLYRQTRKTFNFCCRSSLKLFLSPQNSRVLTRRLVETRKKTIFTLGRIRSHIGLNDWHSDTVAR